MSFSENISDFELGELTSGDALTFLIGGLLVVNAKMVYEWLISNDVQPESRVSPAELTTLSKNNNVGNSVST